MKLHVAVWLAVSVAVQLTVVVPTGKIEPEGGVQATVTLPLPPEVTGAEKFTTLPAGSVVCSVMFPGQVMVGAEVVHLPALPAAFANGEVKGLCARGGFVIDMKWSNGKLDYLKVLSKAGLPLQLRYNDIPKYYKTEKNGVYKFDASLNKL